MLFFWISLDLDLRSQVISWSLLVPSCSIITTNTVDYSAVEVKGHSLICYTAKNLESSFHALSTKPL